MNDRSKEHESEEDAYGKPAEEGRKVLRRPVFRGKVPDGEYRGTVVHVHIIEKESRYEGSYEAIVLRVEVPYRQEYHTRYKEVPIYWEGKKFIDFMLGLDILPEPGEELELDEIKGKRVDIEVKNEEKGGRVYSNMTSIVRVSLSEEASSRKKKKVAAFSEEDEE